jgi:hypothetical protein
LQDVPSVLQQKHFAVGRYPFACRVVEVHLAMLYEVSAFSRLQMSPRAASCAVGTPQLHDLVVALMPSLGLHVVNRDTALFRQTRPDSARLHMCIELQHAQNPLFTAPSRFVHAGNVFFEYRLWMHSSPLRVGAVAPPHLQARGAAWYPCWKFSLSAMSFWTSSQFWTLSTREEPPTSLSRRATVELDLSVKADLVSVVSHLPLLTPVNISFDNLNVFVSAFLTQYVVPSLSSVFCVARSVVASNPRA